jgi:sulfonate transport system substrate-binding protein
VPTRLRSFLTVVAASLAITTMAACGSGRDVNATGGGEGGAAPKDVLLLKHSDPGNAGALAVAKKEGTLEKELAKHNVKLEWVQTPGAFSATVDLFKSGQVNVTNAAVAPVVGLFGRNLGLQIFSVSDVSDYDQSGLIASRQSGVTDIKGLAGKRVAVNASGKGEYLLLLALQKEGVPVDQVERVPLQPAEAASAFATGKVDAWGTWGSFYSEAKKQGGVVLASETKLTSDDLGIQAANEKLLAERPEVFKTWVKVIADLTEQQHQDPERFENVFAKAGPTALSGDRLAEAISIGRTAPVPRIPTAQDRERVGHVAELFLENKVIQQPVDVQKAVYDLNAAKGSA